MFQLRLQHFMMISFNLFSKLITMLFLLFSHMNAYKKKTEGIGVKLVPEVP